MALMILYLMFTFSKQIKINETVGSQRNKMEVLPQIWIGGNKKNAALCVSVSEIRLDRYQIAKKE